jgi:hypothetical protein
MKAKNFIIPNRKYGDGSPFDIIDQTDKQQAIDYTTQWNQSGSLHFVDVGNGFTIHSDRKQKMDAGMHEKHE